MKEKLLLFIFACLTLAGCENDKTDETQDKPVPTKLETPTGLKVDKRQATASSLFVSWDALESEDVESYAVAYALKESESYTEIEILSNQTHITGLEDKKEYKIRIKAVSAEGDQYDSEWSETVSGTTGDVFLMAVPQNLKIVAEETTKTSFKVQWDAVANADAYRVAYKTNAEGAEFETTETENTHFSMSGLEAGSAYIIKVMAVSPSGEDFDSDYTAELPVTTLTRTSGISNAEDFLEFAAEVNDGATDGGTWKNALGEVIIMENIDFEGKSWTPLAKFSGTLDGNGKTISNLVYSSDGGELGLIAQMSGTIKNLTIDASCSFSSTATSGTAFNAAFVAKLLEGGLVDGCINKAAVAGGTTIGGVVGGATSTKEATISNSENHGAVSFPAVAAYDAVKIGGIVGHTEPKTVVKTCKNYGAVTLSATSGAKEHVLGGIAGLASGTTMTNCSNMTGSSVNLKATSYNVIRMGGIVGRAYYPLFSNLTNNAAITVSEATDGNREMRVGGVVGVLQGANTYAVHVEKCTNSADIDVTNTALKKGAYVGGVIAMVADACGLYVDECSNTGDITLLIHADTSSGVGSAAGGVVGYMSTKTGTLAIGRESRAYNCSNSGNISVASNVSASWLHCGGIVAAGSAYSTIEKCTNSGDIESKTINRISVAGIVGETSGPVKDCTNTGTVSALHHSESEGTLAGIVARVMASTTVSGCVNRGNIIHDGGSTHATVAASGVTGRMYSGTIDACENYGTIVDYNTANASSICGISAVTADATIKNCKVGGAIGAYDAEAADKGVSKAAALTQDNYGNLIYAKTTKVTTLADNTFGN